MIQVILGEAKSNNNFIMLFPIKIKNKLDKEYIFKNLKSTNDKIRLNALNKIRVGNVFKTTNCSRIKLTTSFYKIRIFCLIIFLILVVMVLPLLR